MANVIANAEIAPDVAGLTAVDSGNAMGINLTWNIPVSSNLAITEIWASTSNNRATATLKATVVGNTYFFSGYRDQTWYFWIRGVTVYGKANGAFYPVSATAGISATIRELFTYGYNPIITGASSGTGNWTPSSIVEKLLQNQTTDNKSCDLIFNCWQTYDLLAKTTEFEIRNWNGTTETVMYNYGVWSEKVHTPTFVLQDVYVDAGTERRIRLYWKGEDSTVQVKRAQCAVSYDINRLWA